MEIVSNKQGRVGMGATRPEPAPLPSLHSITLCLVFNIANQNNNRHDSFQNFYNNRSVNNISKNNVIFLKIIK